MDRNSTYNRYRPERSSLDRDHRTLDPRDRRDYGFEPSWTSQPPIDFDRRADYSHSSDYARRVADSLNSRSGLVDRGLVKLPSPPHRSAPYDLDSRPSRHDYRPILPTLPKLRPLICKMCDGSNELFICCNVQRNGDNFLSPVIYCSANCQRRDLDSHKNSCTQDRPISQGGDPSLKSKFEQEKKRTRELELQIRDHNHQLRSKENEIDNHKKEVRDKVKDIKGLMENNNRLIADKKAAMEEAKNNEIKKDKNDKIVQQINRRLEKNDTQDKEIASHKETIQSMKQMVQNLMDRYQEAKTDKDRQIKALEERLRAATSERETSCNIQQPPT